jgi:cis-3-alkyl-4-acyloxetan-2-one decarboxylase
MHAMSGAHVIQVDPIAVTVEGADGPVVLMLHGWPDTQTLWDRAVADLSAHFRCVRFTLPGFQRGAGTATSLSEMTALLLRVVEAVSPAEPVTLLVHDWGCAFGYEFAARHPERVQRVIGVDVGDHNSVALRSELRVKAQLAIFAYQFWLALAWAAGGRRGDRMTRWMARRLRCPTISEAVGCQMNYPYAMKWLGSFGGFGSAAPVAPIQPMLYIYGQRKPFMFHSKAWLTSLQARSDCSVRAMPTGHWVMVQQPEAFGTCVRDWLLAGNAAAQAPCLPGAQP